MTEGMAQAASLASDLEQGRSPLLGNMLAMALRDISRTQTDFLGRMGQTLSEYQGIFDDYPDGDLPDEAKTDADEALMALGAMVLAQLGFLRGGDNPGAALATAMAIPEEVAKASDFLARFKSDLASVDDDKTSGIGLVMLASKAEIAAAHVQNLLSVFPR